MSRASGVKIAGHLLTRHLRALRESQGAATGMDPETVEQVCRIADTLTRIDGQRADAVLKALALFATGRTTVSLPVLQQIVRDIDSGELTDAQLAGAAEVVGDE